jgi:glutamyl-tRNA synthetase
MSAVRTRIAPSPTGQDLHIGNAYTALINYVFARANTGKFIIRVEDTDRTRLVTGAEGRILASLKWLGIPYAEGPDIGGPYAPYRQSERLEIYKKYAEELVAKGHAYYCFCTPQRLDQMRKELEAKHLPPMYDGLCKKIDRKESKKLVAAGEKYVIRLNVPDEGTTTFHDIIRGDISFENKLIDDQVLLKSDGYPTYHLGVVIDDHIMNNNHVIRGEEWIPSTPKSVLLYKFFGWELPQFAHVSVLRNPDRSKLSKRKNPAWVSEYKAKGFLPDAIKNYLATMAWSYPGGQDIFSVDEMIKKFRLEDIQTTAPIFDTEKLRWMNGEYIRKMKSEKLITFIYEFYNKQYPEKQIRNVLPLLVERMKTLAEFETLAGFFFVRPKAFERPLNKEILEVGRKALEASAWTHEAMEQSIRYVAQAAKLKAKDVFMELRVAVTGKTVGPPLLESLEILGKEETFTRIPSSEDR